MKFSYKKWSSEESKVDVGQCFYNAAKELIASKDESVMGIAFNLFKKAANEGHLESTFKAGELLAKGRGVTKNIKEAEIYMKKAAKRGHQEAKTALANYYFFGTYGLPENKDEAVRIYNSLTSSTKEAHSYLRKEIESYINPKPKKYSDIDRIKNANKSKETEPISRNLTKEKINKKTKTKKNKNSFLKVYDGETEEVHGPSVAIKSKNIKVYQTTPIRTQMDENMQAAKQKYSGGINTEYKKSILGEEKRDMSDYTRPEDNSKKGCNNEDLKYALEEYKSEIEQFTRLYNAREKESIKSEETKRYEDFKKSFEYHADPEATLSESVSTGSDADNTINTILENKENPFRLNTKEAFNTDRAYFGYILAKDEQTNTNKEFLIGDKTIRYHEEPRKVYGKGTKLYDAFFNRSLTSSNLTIIKKRIIKIEKWKVVEVKEVYNKDK